MTWLIKMMGKSNKGKRGFTLIELMVVVIVVGILAAAAIPIYRFALSRAYSSEAKATMGSMLTSMKIFYVDNDYTYPDEVWGTSSEGATPAGDIMSVLGVDTDTNTWWHCGYEKAVALTSPTCSFGTTKTGLPGSVTGKITLDAGAGALFIWAEGDENGTAKYPIYGIAVVYDIEKDKWYTHY